MQLESMSSAGEKTKALRAGVGDAEKERGESLEESSQRGKPSEQRRGLSTGRRPRERGWCGWGQFS